MELIKIIDLTSIESALTDTTFKDQISENLNGWKEDYSVNDQDFAETKIWIEKIISDFLELCRDVEFDTELSITLFTKYIEMKCYWKQINSQIQYQNFKTGTANSVLIGKASLTTFFLIALEPLINESDLDEIQQFLTKPIKEFISIESSVDISTNTDEVALMESQVDSLYADKEYLYKNIGLTSADEIVETMENLKAQINDLKDEFSNSLILDDRISFIGKRKITIQKQK